MRFLSKMMLAVASVGVLSTSASAQTPANVTVNISNAPSAWVNQATVGNLQGGGWRATVTGIPSSLQVPQDLIVYCFDNLRQFNYNTNMQFTLLSFSDFLNNAGVVSGTRAAQWDNISILDLNYMVEQVGLYDVGATPNNVTRQTNIWATSNNGVANATPFNSDANAYSNSWMILVDAEEWKNGNGLTIDGRQSFLVQIGGGNVVPEPSGFALVGAGLVALYMVSRRRNTIA